MLTKRSYIFWYRSSGLLWVLFQKKVLVVLKKPLNLVRFPLFTDPDIVKLINKLQLFLYQNFQSNSSNDAFSFLSYYILLLGVNSLVCVFTNVVYGVVNIFDLLFQSVQTP